MLGIAICDDLKFMGSLETFNETISIGGNETELKISGDCKKEVFRQLCEIVGRKVVVE